MSGKKKHTTPNEYLKYMKGDLTNQERHSFERNLEADPFEKEAMEGFGQLSPEQAEEDFLSLHARMRKRVARRRRIAVYSIAATVASLLIVGTVFLQIYNLSPDSSHKQFYHEEVDKQLYQEEVNTEPFVEPAESMEPSVEPTGSLDSSVKPVKEEQVKAAEKGAEDKQEGTKGPSKSAAVPAAGVQDVQPFKEVAETEQITHTEAQPMASEKEAPLEEEAVRDMVLHEAVPETKSRKRTDRQKESLSQPATDLPQEMSKKAISQEESDQLISGEASRVVISAEPSGGFKAFKKYIEENIQFPAEDTTTGRAIVILKFAVTPAGEIRDITAIRSSGLPFTNEAIRLVLEGPQWNPASDESGTIEEIIRLRIVFKK